MFPSSALRRPLAGVAEEGPRYDYHPRPVDAYLDTARLLFVAPGGASGVVFIAGIALWTGAMIAAPLLYSAYPQLELSPLIGAIVVGLLLVLSGVLGARWGFHHRRLARVFGTSRRVIWGLGRYGYLALAGFTEPWAKAAWADYTHRIVGATKWPKTVYGRVVTTSSDPASDRYLQYWLFYTFNDWYNRHECDWELVTVRVRNGEGETRAPVAVMLSAHLGGVWRQAHDVPTEPKESSHPVVYVAHGSHAAYFEPRAEGYSPGLTQPLGGAGLRASVTVSGPRTDVVPGRPDGHDGSQYQLIEIPNDLTRLTALVQGKEFPWLAYADWWGPAEAIQGPSAQKPKWGDPSTWARDACTADLITWDSLAPVVDKVD
jgi:hypothetical protein